ncbi:serine/threonine-protein kinase 40-like isoform X2 [Artemia franciscana]|nr:hypothetical protein QYM36_016184 [Artemia franciscana]KAK2706076.1 hypothetical protein QYM36_016184 [Artemia franciscana]
MNKVGPYILGPSLGPSPVKCISQYIAKHGESSKFRTIKVMALKNLEDEVADDKQGKMLIHTEKSLLSLLRGERGVTQCHGLFQETVESDPGQLPLRRLFLVLDCAVPHDFDPESAWKINLQQYFMKEKTFTEKEALTIFWAIVNVVERLHSKNIVHRDIKLGNLIFDCRSKEVTIMNFCLGKHLASDRELLMDKRGSPAYVSPDILSAKPYKGKPSDMWALGVVLYTMLFGQFPFCESAPQELFRKIRAADYVIPSESNVSENACDLVRGLLTYDPGYRLTAAQAKEKTWSVILSWRKLSTSMEAMLYQVVPDLETSEEELMLVKDAEKAVEEEPFENFTGELLDESNDGINLLSAAEPARTPIRQAEGTLRHLTAQELAALLPPNFQSSLLTPPVQLDEENQTAGRVFAQFAAHVAERERQGIDDREQMRRPRSTRVVRPARSRRIANRQRASNTIQRPNSFLGRHGSASARRARTQRLCHLQPSNSQETPSFPRMQSYLSELFSAAGESTSNITEISEDVMSRIQNPSEGSISTLGNTDLSSRVEPLDENTSETVTIDDTATQINGTEALLDMN